MPKAKAKEMAVDVQAYKFKQLAYKSGYNIPEEIRIAYITQTVDRQEKNFVRGFGPFTDTWYKVVKPLLQDRNVSALQMALYRAFMNRYLAKVIGVGKTAPTMTREMVIDEFASLGADRNLLETIADCLEGKDTCPLKQAAGQGLI